MWSELSLELSGATARVAPALVHIGGPGVPGRTGIVWADGLVVTRAVEARAGEAVPVVTSSGPVAATVRAWSYKTGLALLSVPGLRHPGWTVAPRPVVGSLALTVAFPSDQGVESRLDLVRFAGDDVVQTDGQPWPGFEGAAVVNAGGQLVGQVSSNQKGNQGAILPADLLAAEVVALAAQGSPQRAWLGVSTKPGFGQGLGLVAVSEGGPADRAGWKRGDLLLTLGDKPVNRPLELMAVIEALVPGQAVQARLLRTGTILELPVVPEGREPGGS